LRRVCRLAADHGLGVTQPILGWLHCGRLTALREIPAAEVTQPILGWLHCGELA
jgi:hypothetical protein